LMGERFKSALHAAFDGHPNVVEVRGRGLMLGVELLGITSVSVVTEALARGVWVYPGGSGPPVADAVMIAPAFTVEDAHIEQIVAVLGQSIDAVAARR